MSESRIDVTDFLRLGIDATTAFALAFERLDAKMRTVYVPAGEYAIDTTRSIRPPSHCALVLHPEAILRAIPNTVPKDYVVAVDGVVDVRIEGGSIAGDRDSFVAQEGTTSEWGHAIFVRDAKDITVRDMILRDCVGDGLSAGGRIGVDNLVIERVKCQNNRRQGVSLVHTRNAALRACVLADTNGTSPECGIDLEPEADQEVSDTVIENCTFLGNAKYGVNLLGRVGAGVVRRTTLRNNVVALNRGNGVCLIGVSETIIEGGIIHDNRASGLVIGDRTDGTKVDGVEFRRNYTKLGDTGPRDFWLEGTSKLTERDILRRSTALNVVIGRNHYT